MWREQLHVPNVELNFFCNCHLWKLFCFHLCGLFCVMYRTCFLWRGCKSPRDFDILYMSLEACLLILVNLPFFLRSIHGFWCLAMFFIMFLVIGSQLNKQCLYMRLPSFGSFFLHCHIFSIGFQNSLTHATS